MLPNVDTNLSIEKMISAAASAGKLNSENIRTETLPGDAQYIGGASYWVYDKTKSKELITSLFGNYYIGD